MNKVEFIDRYEVLLQWFPRGSDQYIMLNTWYQVSKDYLAQAKTSEEYDWRKYECTKQQLKLEDRIGNDMPLLELRK